MTPPVSTCGRRLSDRGCGGSAPGRSHAGQPEEPSAVVLCRRYVAEKQGEASTRQLAAEGLAAGGDIFDADCSASS